MYFKEGRKTPAELRAEVLQKDKEKDISIYLVIPMAVIAGLSATAALTGIIMMRALVYFRQDVDAYFLTCTPFMFPVVTGLFAAYKKEFSLVTVHFVTLLLTMLLGGFGIGVSVEPIFTHRDDCVQTSPEVECSKDTISYLYIVSAGLAAGFTFLGFLITIFGLYTARIRIGERNQDAFVKHMHDIEEDQKRIRLENSHDEVLKQRARALSRTSMDYHHYMPIATNGGVPKGKMQDGHKVDGPASVIKEQDE